MSVDLITSALASKPAKKAPKAGKKVVRHMHITKAKGGYHIIHKHDNPEHDQAPEEQAGHMAANTDALHDHIEEHFGEPNPGEAEAAEEA